MSHSVENDARPAPCATCGHSEIVPMHTGGRGVICECGCRNYVPAVSHVIPPAVTDDKEEQP